MNIFGYINKDINPLPVKGTLGDAQEFFSQTTYSHVPVMENDIYIGCLAENDVHCHKAETLIDEKRFLLEGFFVREDTIWLNVLEALAQKKANIMPVLDQDNTYLGFYELGDIISYFDQTPFLAEPGNIIIIERGIHDYSFSQISQIVESNEGKLLGALVSNIENDVAQISLKISGQGSFNEILQSFRRYGYLITSNHQEDAYIKDLRERSKYLEKYLNI